MTNGLEKLTYGTPEPEIKEAFRKVFYKGTRKIEEPTGLMGQPPYEPPEFKQKPIYGITEPIKEPKKTESREFQAGQVSEEEQQRLLQNRQIKKEYMNFFMTQTDLKDDKYWQERLPTANLPQLEDLYGQYQEWQEQKQQQMITQFGEQLGLSADMVGQIQSAYPPEEVAPKLQLAGMYMTLLKSKHTSATLIKQFQELMFPEVEEEEEPDMGERLGEYKQYGELTGEEGQYAPTDLPFDITSELDPKISAFARDMAEGLQGITSVEQLDANELLNAVMNNYYGNDEAMREEAKQMINYTLQKMIGQTIDFTLLE